MRTKLALVSAVVVLLLTAVAVRLSAHHAFAAEFDANKPVKFEGTVTRMQWTNPHVWLLCGCEEARRQGRKLGFRGWYSERFVSTWL